MQIQDSICISHQCLLQDFQKRKLQHVIINITLIYFFSIHVYPCVVFCQSVCHLSVSQSASSQLFSMSVSQSACLSVSNPFFTSSCINLIQEVFTKQVHVKNESILPIGGPQDQLCYWCGLLAVLYVDVLCNIFLIYYYDSYVSNYGLINFLNLES